VARLTAAGLAQSLGAARPDGRGWRCRCPAHDDHDPSLSIVERDDTVLFTCRAGCDQGAVVAALRQRGLWPEARDDERQRIVAEYPYRDEDGAMRYQVVRLAPKKDFRQRRPNGAPDRWLWNMHGVEPLPYRLPELLADPNATVFVVEGEKDVDNLFNVGILATCNHGGAGKWRPEISRWLAGRHVAVVPDNDDQGRSHAGDVARKLAGIAASIRILELPDLPPKGDVSEWLARGGTADDLDQLLAAAKPAGQPETSIDIDLLRGTNWLAREIPEPGFLLGGLLSTTSRLLLIGPTGLGKTNLLVALGMAIADGRDFLHWRGNGRPRRVLYLDGEMSRRLARKRLVDAAQRHGGMPPTFWFLNREDYPDLDPLNTEAGQRFIDGIVEAIGGIDLIIFDNVQALLTGNMQEEEPWQQALSWIRDLTRRDIGQIWAHHTGHDESRGYGTKTREWQLDTVLLMETVEHPEADIAFKVKFTKARERTPENRSDFEEAVIILAADRWSSERGHVGAKRPAKDRAFDLLRDAIAREGEVPPANGHIPPAAACVTEDLWRRYCEAGCISEGSVDAARMAFKRAAKKLVHSGRAGKWENWVWIVR
jgi:hypothetical protein